jgi:hypothetical protein
VTSVPQRREKKRAAGDGVSAGRWAGEKVLAVLLAVVVWCVIDVTQKEEENLITSETGKWQNTQRQAETADGREQRREGGGETRGEGD